VSAESFGGKRTRIERRAKARCLAMSDLGSDKGAMKMRDAEQVISDR
jgi:hypothetical protein